MIRWETCKSDFRPDGSLRDIYILSATLRDWQSVLDLLRFLPEARYSFNDIVGPIPETIVEIFKVQALGSPMLNVPSGSTSLNFHFFTEDEVECDLLPNSVTSQADLDAILDFMSLIGNSTWKQVLLTPENCREHPIIIYDPPNEFFQYCGESD